MSSQQIRERAYYLWVQRGRPPGQPLRDWLEAEQQHFQSLRLLYNVRPANPSWGNDVVLSVDGASGLNFGTLVTPPCRAVVGGSTGSKVLTIKSWATGSITATLPAEDPNFQPLQSPNLYRLAVDTTTATAVTPNLLDRIPIGTIAQTLLYSVDAPAHWGRPATLRTLANSPLNFGDSAPRVRLLGANRSIDLTPKTSSPTVVEVPLPTYDPAFTPLRAPNFYSLGVDTSAGTDFRPTLGDFMITLPGPNLCDVTILENAVNELLTVTASNTRITPLTPPSRDGNLSRLDVTLLKGPGFDAPQSEQAKLLKDLLLNGQVRLAFGFKIISALDAARFNRPMFGSLDATLADIARAPLTVIAGLIPVPNFATHESSTSIDRATWVFRVEVNVTLLDLPACNGVTASVKSPPIFVLPIQLPTLVAGFDVRHFEGPKVIVFLRPQLGVNLGLESYYDRYNRGQKRPGVDALLGILRVVSRVITLLREEFARLQRDPLAIWPGGAAELPGFIHAILELDTEELVVTGESERNNLDYATGWNDALSSLLMIGVPDSITTFKLFENHDQKGAELHLRMPAGFVAASYWTLHESAFGKQFRASFASPPTVPDPGTHQEGRADGYPWGHFYNLATSFRWDPPG